MLQKIAASKRGLSGPEFEGDVAGGGVEDAGGCGLGLEVVEGGHVSGLLRRGTTCKLMRPVE